MNQHMPIKQTKNIKSALLRRNKYITINTSQNKDLDMVSQMLKISQNIQMPKK